MRIFIVDAGEQSETELQQEFLRLVSKSLLSYGEPHSTLFQLVYSLFCIQDGNDNALSLILTDCNGSNVELRRTVLSKTTLSSITKAVEGICNKSVSIVAQAKPTLNAAISSLLLYEKPESLELYHLLLSPVYLNKLEGLDALKDKQVRATRVVFLYSEVDTTATLPTTIRGLPLREMECQEEVRRWLRLSYQPHCSVIHLPALFAQVHVTEIPVAVTPFYLMERPFLPTTSAFLYHKGLERLELLAVTPQSAIELALLLPLWHCQSPSKDPCWASLLRFLASTASSAILSCYNPKVGLKEFYVLLSAKCNTAVGLLCRYASFEQILPPANEESSVSTTENLKFDLSWKLGWFMCRLLHQLRKDRYSPIENGSGFFDQMYAKIKAL